MDANAWIALASFAVVIFVQIAVTAFVMGGLFQRVKDLERNAPDIAALIRGLAKLEHAVEGNVKAVDSLTKRFDDTVGWLGRVEGYAPQAPTGRAKRS